MDIHIRKIESKDYTSAAAIWRDVLGFSSVTDENVVETLAIGHPNGYMKMNGLH